MTSTGTLTKVAMLGEYAVARLQGEIDLSNARDLGEELLEAAPGTVAGLIIDLEDVQYVDSAGVRMLFDVVRQLEAKRQAVAVSIPESTPIKTLLKVTGVHEVIPVHQTPEKCAESLGLAEGSEHD